jgi:Uma2 family endonuclease
MTTASIPAPSDSARLLTAADLAAMPSQLPSGPVDYELDHGRLVMMSPPGNRHGAVQAIISTELIVQGQRRGLGKALSEVGIILSRAPDCVVAPDAVFIASRSLPVRESPEGYLETIPELVVEVRSQNDGTPQLDRKIHDYLNAGVQLVWVIDPVAKTVTVYRRGAEPHVLTQSDKLSAEDVIPGFSVAIAELLRE